MESIARSFIGCVSIILLVYNVNWIMLVYIGYVLSVLCKLNNACQCFTMHSVQVGFVLRFVSLDQASVV